MIYPRSRYVFSLSGLSMDFGSVERVNGGMALDTGCSGSGVGAHRSLPWSARTCNCKFCKETVHEINRDFFTVDFFVTLIESKIKFSSYTRKFRRDRVQSHLWLTASSYRVKYFRISSYIRKPFLIYYFVHDPIWISLNMRKMLFSFFHQCNKEDECKKILGRNRVRLTLL
jgi:hypothetical protein